MSADYKAAVSARKVCGITVMEDLDSYQGMISTISELYEQKDLREMHFKALDKYQSKHKRNWPSRVVRGRGPSYEEDIDGRMRKLPDAVQSEISNLLADREDSSSNRFHNRAWTVVMMQEQLHRRFANVDPTVVPKRHKVRFWKNPGKNERSEYLIIIRGGERRRFTEEKGQSEFKRFENPWRKADEAEMWKKASEQRARRRERIKDAAKAAPPSHWYRVPPGPPSPVFNPPKPGFYPPPDSSYAVPPPPPPPRSWSYPPPPAPTPPASYPTPPPVRCAQSTSHCPPRFPYLDMPAALRPAAMNEQPSYSQRQQTWHPRGDPNGCCGPAATYHPPMRQAGPTSNPQSHIPFDQILPRPNPTFRSGAVGAPLDCPRPKPVFMSVDIPIRVTTPCSIDPSPDVKISRVMIDYESEDEVATIINGGARSILVEETVKYETNGEDEKSAGKK